MKKIYLTFLLILISSQVLAETRYRDEPLIIDPPKTLVPRDQITPVIKKFEQSYKIAGRPKIALFWNIELSDSLKDRHIKTHRISGETNESVNSLEKTTNGTADTAKLIDGDDKSKFNVTTTDSTEQITTNNKRSTSVSERDMWQAQTAFMNTMRKAGVKFIDRNSILRTTALKESTENLPEIETKALMGKANLLMEVLMTSDKDAPLGWGFKVSVRDLKTGEEKTSLYSQAHPILAVPSQSSYVATDKGYEKIAYQQQATVNDVGVALAIDVMNEMKSDLSPSK